MMVKRYKLAIMGVDEGGNHVYAEMEECDNGDYRLNSDCKALERELEEAKDKMSLSRGALMIEGALDRAEKAEQENKRLWQVCAHAHDSILAIQEDSNAAKLRSVLQGILDNMRWVKNWDALHGKDTGPGLKEHSDE